MSKSVTLKSFATLGLSLLTTLLFSFFYFTHTTEAAGTNMCAPISDGEIRPGTEGKKFNPGHYMVVSPGNNDTPQKIRQRIDKLLAEPEVKGITYFFTWKELEPRKDEYDLSGIKEILDIVAAKDRHLILKIIDRSFWTGGCDAANSYMPQYIRDAGWVYLMESGIDPNAPGKCMPKMWVDEYMDRKIKLLNEIGKEFDSHPNFEAMIMLDESALGKPKDGSPMDFNGYVDNIIRLIKETAPFYQNTLSSISLNSLRSDENLQKVIEQGIIRYKTALSWPDAQLDNIKKDLVSYPQQWAAENKNFVPLSPDADNTFLKYDPDAGTSDVQAVIDYYVGRLGANHISWQPTYATNRGGGFKPLYFENALIPTLRANNAEINTTCPETVGVCLNTSDSCTGTPPPDRESPRTPAGVKCSLYGQTGVTESSYANPYSYSAGRVNLEAYCTATSTEIVVGVGSEYVGKYIEYRRVGDFDWSSAIPLDGENSLYSSYLNRGARAIINRSGGEGVYEVRANICKREGSVMKCNCKNGACNHPPVYWTKQAFRLGTSTPSVDDGAKFRENDRIEVDTDRLNVRNRDSDWSPLGTQNRGVLGTITSSNTGYYGDHKMWSVNFDNGVDGWSSEQFLTKHLGSSTTPEYGSPIITSKSRVGNDGLRLKWRLGNTSVEPEAGYEVSVDDNFDPRFNTTSNTQLITGLSLGRHCFGVRALWAQANPDVLAMNDRSRTCVNIVNRDLYPRPVLGSVVGLRGEVELSWTMPRSSVGLPRGGYDIIVDGLNTRSTYRTTNLTQTVSGLSAGRHCFAVSARYTNVYPILLRTSTEKCVMVD